MTEQPEGPDGPKEARFVVRDERKVDRVSGRPRHAAQDPEEKTVGGSAEKPSSGGAPRVSGGTTAVPAEQSAGTAQPPAADPESAADPKSTVGDELAAQVSALQADLDERTADLLRITAEYANYRKRVERDRTIAAEQATRSVLAALLPVLDDLDRVRDHGDLVGPFATIADQLVQALSKFGLAGFGTKGDPFDPTRHEAVAHLTSDEVGEPTCTEVMRRGYLLGERMLRPALVAVTAPQ